MQLVVIKRDGTKEEFSPEKIVVSCLKAGAPLEVARRIARVAECELLGKGVTEISTKELMKIVLSHLRKENEEWYQNWIIFDRAVKRRRAEEQ